MLNRFSPNTLYGEVNPALLQPNIRSVELLLPSQMQGAILGSPLLLRDSLLPIWP